MSGLEAHAPLILKEVSSQTEQEEDQASKYCIYTLVIKMLSPVEKIARFACAHLDLNEVLRATIWKSKKGEFYKVFWKVVENLEKIEVGYLLAKLKC